MHNFLRESTQHVARPSLGEQPVRGMQQALMDRLSFYKKITEACVLDKERHAAMKGW